MSLYRDALPQLKNRLFLTDGGIETTLIFHDGLELPDFAAFHLLRTAAGQIALRKYFASYVSVAQQFGTGIVLETATWRANADWARKLGYSDTELAAAIRESVRLIEDLRPQFPSLTLVISGCLGPRGDGYVPGATMTDSQAADYHRAQIETFAATSADLVTAFTINYLEEALGIARAARDAGMPVVISFTVETDGTLPSGQSLSDAIEEVDASTGAYPSYYMLNCAHPTHFADTLRAGSKRWTSRLRGLRANASRMSHAELNEAPSLDTGDPAELGRQYAHLTTVLPHLNVMGGCCGTDDRHIASIAAECAPLFNR